MFNDDLTDGYKSKHLHVVMNLLKVTISNNVDDFPGGR